MLLLCFVQSLLVFSLVVHTFANMIPRRDGPDTVVIRQQSLFVRSYPGCDDPCEGEEDFSYGPGIDYNGGNIIFRDVVAGCDHSEYLPLGTTGSSDCPNIPIHVSGVKNESCPPIGSFAQLQGVTWEINRYDNGKFVQTINIPDPDSMAKVYTACWEWNITDFSCGPEYQFAYYQPVDDGNNDRHLTRDSGSDLPELLKLAAMAWSTGTLRFDSRPHCRNVRSSEIPKLLSR